LDLPTRALALSSALDYIQFDGINLDAVLPQPFHGGGKDFLIAGKFQGDDANLVGDVGAADVEINGRLARSAGKVSQ
jgi:hypothetical protein